MRLMKCCSTGAGSESPARVYAEKMRLDAILTVVKPVTLLLEGLWPQLSLPEGSWF